MTKTKAVTLGLIFFAGAGAFFQPAFAQQNTSSMNTDGSFAQLLACRAMTDPVEKSACYDAAVDEIQRVAQGGNVSIVTDVQIENLERDAFGFNLPSLPKLRLPTLAGVQKHSIDANSVSAKGDGAGTVVSKDNKGEIVKITFDLERMVLRPNGRARFILTNGQSWVQTDNSQIRVSQRRAKFVEIKKGAIGSYLLRINGVRNAIRVKREN